MSSLRYRLAMLEGATKHRLKPSVRACVLILTCEATPDQQAELDEAKRTHRPILIIRGTLTEIDPALSVIVEVGEYGGSGSPKPDMTRLRRPESWE